MATFDVYSAASSVPNPYSSFMTVEDPTAAIISTAPTRKRWREETTSWDVDDQQYYDDDDDIMVASKSPRTQYHHPDPSSFMHNSTTITSAYDSYVVSAAQPIVTVLQSEGAKRPQLKYDPDVPMTKEQTRAWRRDQRRRRNRESAAACRKRQRDAIFVLEAEVAVWKAKFDNALSKIQERDGECAAAELQAQIESRFVMPTTTHHRQMRERSSSCATPPPNEAHVPDEIYSSMGMHNNMGHPSNVISPYEQPQFISYHASTTSTTYHHQHHHELHFPVLDDDAIAKANHGAGASPDEFKHTSRVEKRQHLNEIITRPAVKIAGAVISPLDNIESVCDDLLQVVPDSCISSLMDRNINNKTYFHKTTTTTTGPIVPISVPSSDDAMMLTSASTATSTTTTESIPGVSTDESDEDSDLDEFLLDAALWL